MKTAYAAVVLKEILEFTVAGSSLAMTVNWAPGMIGAFAVFRDRQSALEYVGGDENLILAIRLEERQTH
jgi:hypothetical protein